MNRRINWTGLEAFEAAGRLGNLTLAGEEMGLTVSAVSRQIAGLEDQVGFRLFNRTNKGVSLTPEGAEYIVNVRSALDDLRDGRSGIGERRREKRLVVSVLPTFLNRWLMPRLRRFSQMRPDIELSISKEYRAVDFTREDYDMAVRYGDGHFNGLASSLLFEEVNTPVCTMSMLDRMLGDRRFEELQPRDLSHTTLLYSGTCALNWDEWFVYAGCPTVADEARRMHFDSCMDALDGARFGVGAAVANIPYVQSELRDGSLVAPFRILQPKRQGWWIVHPSGFERQEKVGAFKAWMMEEAAIMQSDISAVLRRDTLG